MSSYHVLKAKESLQRKRAKVEAMKSGPCTDCGRTFHPCVMDFDHVRGEKVKNVAWLLTNASWQAVLDEIEKCELVCSNCHRLRSFSRMGPDYGKH